MFGRVQKFARSPRCYAVDDAVVQKSVFDVISAKDPHKFKRSGRDRDLQRIDFGKAKVAVNVRGQQCHLVLMRVGDLNSCFVAYTTSQTIVSVPMKFESGVFQNGPVVARCTISHPNHVWVVDSVCLSPTRRCHKLARELVTANVSDPFLFPMRVVSRPVFKTSQMGDLEKFITCHRRDVHSVEVFAGRGWSMDVRV